MPQPRRDRVAGLAAGLVLALAGCAPSPRVPPTHPDELLPGDFQGRHVFMLDAATERPERFKAQRAERERLEALRALESWGEITARQTAYWELLAERRRRAQEAFARMVESQRRLKRARDEARVQRWIEFVERHGAPAP